MAWWQKKFLGFCLKYLGIFDDAGIDLDNLDIALGQQSSVELRDVALSTDRLSKLIELPPGLRIEAAKVLRLKLSVPLNVFSGTVTFEADGVRVNAKYQDGQAQGNYGTQTPGSGNPQHRKTHRRIGGILEDMEGDDRPHIPTAEEMARSFLLERPPEERKKLEASLAADLPSMDESMMSETSEDSEVGTGSPVGLPGMFAGYVQGFMDRCQVRINDVEVTLYTSVARESLDVAPLSVKVRMESAALMPFDNEAGNNKRSVKLGQLTVDLLSTGTIFTDLSGKPSKPSPTISRTSGLSPFSHGTSQMSSIGFSTTLPSKSNEVLDPVPEPVRDTDVTRVLSSQANQPEDLSGNAEESASPLPAMNSSALLDIRLGDDNISWGSRRNNTNLVEDDDLWNSTEDLPDSLLIEQATAPRDKSRSTSPEVFRHAQSTYVPVVSWQSPGSWPLSDHSPGDNRSALGPETGPSLNPGGSRQESEDLTALPVQPSSPDCDSPIERAEAALVENMTESRLYTREEAESMYMSAMSHGPADDQQSDSDDEEPVLSFTFDRVIERKSEHDIETPRPSSPILTTESPNSLTTNLVSRQLLVVESVILGIPRPQSGETIATEYEADPSRSDANQKAKSRAMPGTFSVYSDATASRMQSQRTAREAALPDTHAQEGKLVRQAISIAVGPTRLDLDIACCRTLHSMFCALANPAAQSKAQPKRNDTRSVPRGAINWPSVSMSIGSVSVHFHERLPSTMQPRVDDTLCSLLCGHTNFESSPDRIQVNSSSLSLCVGQSRLFSFGDSEPSSAFEDPVPNLSVELAKERAFINGMTSFELHVECVPVKINVDLHTIEQAFNSFGGISGFLDLSSMLDEGSLTPTASWKAGKGVRFEQQPESVPGQEAKANVRIEGMSVVLQGESASVELQTSVVRAIYRDDVATATIDRLKLTGPHSAHGRSGIPAEVGIDALRIDFLQSPRDKDLERLLALLTPSKDKYDSDDDILLDTLLRQRRKGSLARVAVGDINCKIHTFECLETMQRLVQEMSTLAAVAKYLPEDERPGLLTLLRLSQVNTQLPVNERFGELDVSFKDLYLAYVGIPALLALSVQSIQAGSKSYGEIVHSFLPLSGPDNLPLVMARMLGDEAEPVARMKLYNICVEYSVPALLALTGLEDDAEGEQLVNELAESVATLNAFSRAPRSAETSPRPDSSPSKPLKIDLLMHDLAVNLSPINSPSKAALVLTDAKFTTSLPSGDYTAANLELRKTALFLTDDNTVKQPCESRHAPRNSSSTSRVAAALAQQGFASIASIMSASICVKIENIKDSDVSQSVRVDVRNELLLLETCADSTQTLFGLLSGLAPPPRPDKQPKYLTQPMPIEDMMACFTGDAYQQPFTASTRETLFDVEDSQEADSFMDNVGDELLAESDMTSSLYGPISGMLTGVDRPEDDEESSKGDWEGAVESLLEDDPFEMPTIPADAPLSDAALMRDLNKQSQRAVSAGEASLDFTEIEDLGLEALGLEQNALGTIYKFNTPTAPRAGGRVHSVLPVQLHLRDAHVIWNIYDGYDWQRTRDGITEAVEKVESKVEERQARRRRSRNDPDEDESVIGDFLFNSIYIGVPTSQEAQDIRRQINRHIDDLASETESVPISGISRPTTQHTVGGSTRNTWRRRRLKLDRSRAHKVAFELKGLSADVLVMPPKSETTLQNIQLRVRDFEIFDNVPTSTWRKFLTHLESETHHREMAKPMMHIEVDNVKTNAASETAELKINVTVAPLRLHVDQDALDFITRFFEFKDKPNDIPNTSSEQPFIQRLEVNTVDLRLDYKPKHVDYAGLRSGHTSEFMNFVTLDGADIRLRHAIVYGIKGFEPLHKTLNDIWMPDVIRNQLPTVLSGLAPVRSLVNLSMGIRDVVAIPVREYRKDGRLVRSIQKGAFQFGKTTAAELARLGAKVALGTQNILQGAEVVLSGSGPASSSQRGPLGAAWQDIGTGEEEEHEHRAISSYADQPLGVLSGLRSARQHLERDLLTARDAFIAVQGEVLESSSPGTAAAAVARHAPTLILRPVIGASRAVGTALLGVGNQIDRGNVRRVDDASALTIKRSRMNADCSSRNTSDVDDATGVFTARCDNERIETFLNWNDNTIKA